MANHVAKPQYNFWESTWNHYSKYAGFTFCFADYSLLVFSQFYANCTIPWWIKNSYFAQGVLLEHSGKGTFHLKYRTYKGHGSKRQWRSFCFIFVIFKNLDTKFSQNVENQVANSLYNFWEPVWNNYSKTIKSVFRSPHYPFTIFPQLYASFPMRQWI